MTTPTPISCNGKILTVDIFLYGLSNTVVNAATPTTAAQYAAPNLPGTGLPTIYNYVQGQPRQQSTVTVINNQFLLYQTKPNYYLTQLSIQTCIPTSLYNLTNNRSVSLAMQMDIVCPVTNPVSTTPVINLSILYPLLWTIALPGSSPGSFYFFCCDYTGHHPAPDPANPIQATQNGLYISTRQGTQTYSGPVNFNQTFVGLGQTRGTSTTAASNPLTGRSGGYYGNPVLVIANNATACVNITNAVGLYTQYNAFTFK